MEPNEPVKNVEPSMPEGMKRIDTSKLDPAKLKAIQDKLKGVDFSVGSQDGYTQDDKFIEGVESGAGGAIPNPEPDRTGTKPRISFKQPKRTPPARQD